MRVIRTVWSSWWTCSHRAGRSALQVVARRAHACGVDDSIIVEQLRALGDPVRWAIVRELRDGTRCACRLAEVAGVSSTLLSHHVKVLREAGLISGVRRGRWIDYSLEASSIERLAWCLQPTLAVAS